MAASTIDTLLQIAVPPRPVEPPARGGGESAFGPALEKAYASEKPREASPLEDHEEPLKAPVDQAADSHDSAEEWAEESDAIAESAAPIEEVAESEDDSSGDEVEISELASSAVAAEDAHAAVLAAQSDAAVVELVGDATEGHAVEGGVVDESSDPATVAAQARTSGHSRADIPLYGLQGNEQQQPDDEASSGARGGGEDEAVQGCEAVEDSSP